MRTGYKVLRKNGKEHGSYHNGLYGCNMGVYRGHIGGTSFLRAPFTPAQGEACDLTAMRHKDWRTRQGLGLGCGELQVKILAYCRSLNTRHIMVLYSLNKGSTGYQTRSTLYWQVSRLLCYCTHSKSQTQNHDSTWSLLVPLHHAYKNWGSLVGSP